MRPKSYQWVVAIGTAAGALVINFDSISERLAAQHGPLTDRLRSTLASAIEDGLIEPGEALPSERELAARLDVSRSTVRQSLKDLADMGLVTTRPGAGTRVIGRIPKALTRLSGFSEDMRLRGLLPSSKVLELAIGPVPSDTAFRTGLPLDTLTLALVRLRCAGGEALSYERAVVPVACVGDDYDGSGSLYERMDEKGARPRRVLQQLEAVGASDEIAELLDIGAGAAVLKIAQVGYGADGTAVEDAVSWYRGDRYRYVGEIRG
ncbi:GntR family transcriptional regulator [Bauldia sp.]|uniref:GntR family transcriptional regulator n=1 Tax=Bauldia sp. TaxID=2575872 RepID=UPI003BA96FBA